MVKIEELTALDFFRDIDNGTLAILASKAFKKALNKSEILFAERDKVETVYIVFSGKVTMFRNSEIGQKRVVYILNEGELINEVIFDDLPASINCEAFEDSIILCFLKNDLLEIMAKDFKLTRKVMDSMGKKIRRLYRQIKNTVPIKMDKKLAAKLWKLSKDYGINTEEGVLIDINISITYLADMLGSTRETISRCINDFEKKGLIKFINKKILVISRDELSMYFRGM